MSRGPSSFTQEDAVRILKAKQKMEKAAQKTGISLDGAKVTINTHGGGSIVIDFQIMNGDIGKSGSRESEWDVPPAGTGRVGR
jgi:hypothetical protein